MTSTGVALEIANAITKLHRDHYGRGAAKARTVVGRDHVIVFLDDIYTTVERTLIDAGEFAIVKETRQAFQRALRPAFVDAVERITGRHVVAFMSQTHADPDVAAEIFVLEREA